MQLAQKIARDLEQGKGNHPFNKVVWCNIGNPQILGQKPITYFRQVLSLCECPQVRGGRRRGGRVGDGICTWLRGAQGRTARKKERNRPATPDNVMMYSTHMDGDG